MYEESDAVEGYERPTPKLHLIVVPVLVAIALLLATFYACPGSIGHY